MAISTVRFWLLAALLILASATRAQSSLPPCPWTEARDNCFGEASSSSGETYIGEFKGGRYHGQGTVTWINGQKYVGEFKYGQYNGRGTLTMADGNRYVGEFKNNNRHGQGIQYRANGSVLNAGLWVADKLIEPAQAQPSATDAAPAIQTDPPSMTPTTTTFNEYVAIGLVLGGLLWLVGRWQWRKLNNEADHSGKAKLESAKNFLFVTLGVDIVATSGVVASYAWAVATLKDMSSGLITADQSLISRLSALDALFLVLLLTTIGVGVGMVKWLNACYRYAKEVIGATGFKQEGFATSIAWFIPLYNLFKPYQIINEVYKTGALGYALPDGWKKESSSGPLLTWWIFWAFIHIVWSAVSLILKKSKPTDFSISTIELQAWILVTSVVIALLWFVVAGSLTRRLLNRSSAVPVAPVVPSHQSPPRTPSPPIAPSRQATNFEQIASPVGARESAQSTPKSQVTSSDEETIYEQALTELSANKKPGLWAMALAQTANGGNPEGAYIALRVEQLKQERLQETELAGIARDSRARLAQQGFFDSVAAAQQGKETSAQFKRHYQALVHSKNPLDGQKLIWLCDYDTLRPGDDPGFPDKYLVRRSPGDEPFAVFDSEPEFVKWAVKAFAVRQSNPVEYL